MPALTANIKSTGEILSFEADTIEQVIASYQMLNEYAKALEGIKKDLQAKALDLMDGKAFYDNGAYGIRVSHVQRMTYDKAVLRQVLDEDTFDLMLEPAKGRVDAYIKENLDVLGENSSRLRETMVPTGSPYVTVRLERLVR